MHKNNIKSALYLRTPSDNNLTPIQNERIIDAFKHINVKENSFLYIDTEEDKQTNLKRLLKCIFNNEVDTVIICDCTRDDIQALSYYKEISDIVNIPIILNLEDLGIHFFVPQLEVRND